MTLRRNESTPILLGFKERLLAWKVQLFPNYAMAAAIACTLNQWTELNVFAGDGAVPIDNNVSEREMKRIALNGKNRLFVDNERGGATAAVLSSRTRTCRRHGVNPQLYLTQLLVNLPATQPIAVSVGGRFTYRSGNGGEPQQHHQQMPPTWHRSATIP